MFSNTLRSAYALCAVSLALAVTLASSLVAQDDLPRVDTLALGRQPLIHNVGEANERLEMIVNTSRILTLEQKIPKAQVNNPEILTLTPLSPTQIQVAAQKPGVTQVNLWAENGGIHSIDVVVYGDAQELQMMLATQFPSASLKVVPLSNSVVVSGNVDRPELVSRIIEVAQDYYPNVINNVSVGGVQQVLLHVKVMEVSRTKLRNLGVDFLQIHDSSFFGQGVTGLLRAVGTGMRSVSGGETMAVGIANGNDQFYGLLEALRQNNLMKILAEPDLVTVSGRPASFNVGGEFPVLVPQSLGTVSIEYKKFGTQIDFVPIVMGGNMLHLEVRPRVSEIDPSRSVLINDIDVPALRVREVDTGVKMRAGQTLAIAGLVQTRTEALNRGIPYLSDLPYVGAAFRKVREEVNEVELLILVTPELVDAMDCDEVPPGGPGLSTMTPSDTQLYWHGELEVPVWGNHYPVPKGRGQHCVDGCVPQGGEAMYGPGMQGGRVLPPGAVIQPGEAVPAPQGMPESPDLPPLEAPSVMIDRLPPANGDTAGSDNTAYRRQPTVNRSASLPGYRSQAISGSGTYRTAARQNPQTTQNSYSTNGAAATRDTAGQPGLIGPVGYDVRN